MNERKETVIFQNKVHPRIHSDVVDDVTWWLAYEQGIRPARYPIAHQYITLIAPHSVEMCLGIVRTYDGDYIGYDCECVLYVTDYPKITKIR